MAPVPVLTAVLTACVLFQRADSQYCREGWQYHEGSCYSLGTTSATWGVAQAICNVYKAKLAEIETSEENDFLKNLAKTKETDHTHVGGTDMFNEGTWEWASSGMHIYPFSDWSSGEPNGGTGGCLALSRELTYQWADVNCNDVDTFICEAKSSEGPIVG
ncbi:hypothetical protein BsWGS_28422 [Bradybaena similaris]